LETSPGYLYPRLIAAAIALAAGVGAVVFVLTLLRDLPPVASPTTSSQPATAATTTTSSAVPSAPTTVSAFPTPPRGSVVYGAEAGSNAVGLAVSPRKNGVGLQASVVGIQGNGVRGLPVRFEVRGPTNATVAGKACGPGCYRATAPVSRPREVTLVVGPHRVAFAMPAQWPAPSAASLVSDASRVYRNLHTLIIHDNLGDGHVVLHTVYEIVAPDRLAYQVAGSSEAIIIGNTLYYKLPNEKTWHSQPQLPVKQPTPFWVTAEDAHRLGTVTVNGRPAWKVSFFDPQTPGWYTLLIDKANFHTLDMLMTAHAHFMHDTYGSFDEPITVNPPA
jgi:hypothetical protein